MKTFSVIALIAAMLVGTVAYAAEPEGWSRPGGYHDQVKANRSLSTPVDPCKVPTCSTTTAK
jgi:hypothetical protein